MLNEEYLNKLLSISLKCKTNSPIKSRVTEMFNNYDFDEKSLIVALVYLERYSLLYPLYNKNILQILTACILVANKFLEDIPIFCSYPHERDLVNKLNWRLFVDETEYSRMSGLYSSQIQT
jgi:hypothetical protein